MMGFVISGGLCCKPAGYTKVRLCDYLLICLSLLGLS